jgi:HSP20 family protein
MANVPVRRESNVPSTEFFYGVNPLQTVREFFRMDPFAAISRAWPFDRRMTYSPHFDVKETGDSFIFKADVPGVREQDLEVLLNHNRLIVAGKRETEIDEKQSELLYETERRHGNFSRSFSLPRGVDSNHCQADLRNGVLTVQVPKSGESTMKKIAVKAEKARS